ncbi:MAG: UDP-2,3-diacylglucosamine diphosphatase [Bacteroidales bacterium]|nr:UDP-2,3-diacylglucosamine diphosphatase [Bacteroidales bacterium]MCU0407649.1 UDP-2,3-diacylglucosamine diphosphatase [Bacteroidales bacterium]
MEKNSKIYFASDFHLGLPAGSSPVLREKRVTAWLRQAAADATEIFLLGDVFDFWWEYRHVVPKGFTRFLGAVSEITDSGIPVHFFTGNHDMWTGSYLSEECGMIVHYHPLTIDINGKIFHLAHGEGLGSQSIGYKVLLSVFRNKTLQKLYSSLHPAIGVGIGQRWSLSSRLGKGVRLEFMGDEKEDLIRYAKQVMMSERVDYFIFGHRHLEMKYMLSPACEIVFLGDWINGGSYAVWDGSELRFEIIS